MDQRDRARLRELRDRRWSARDATWVLELAEREGLAVGRLAREHGYHPQRLYWWQSRVGRPASQVPPSKRFLPVRLVESVPDAADSASRRQGAVMIETNAGIRIHLEPGFDAATLARALEVIGVRC